MKQFLFLLFVAFVVIFVTIVYAPKSCAQTSGNVTMVLYPGVPTGVCNARQLGLNQSTGQLYSCSGTSWLPVSSVPATASGNTVFGNNTANTTAPGFFAPGGDVALNAGSFNVNALHFGSTGLPLVSTGITAGNCIQVSSGASSLIGGPCGTGPASTLNQTVTYTASPPPCCTYSGDNGKLVLMNCTAACTYTLQANVAGNVWRIKIMSVGTVNAQIALTGGLQYNGAGSGVPFPITLQAFQPIDIWADFTLQNAYWGNGMLLPGTNVSFSPINPTGLTINSSGAAGAGVTTFSAGGLTPIFTASVTNPNSTPALAFTLTNAPASTMLGNTATSAGPPSWVPIPTASGSGLTGCSTPTSGNLACTSSLAVTATGVGYISMSSGALPAPPTGASGTIAADANGGPNWSTGNGAAFIPLVTSTALSSATTGFVQDSDFTNCNSLGWSSATTTGTCGDPSANFQSASTYTIQAADKNRVVFLTAGGSVAVTLPPPTGSFAAPFRFVIDTYCASDVIVTATAPGSIVGTSTLEIFPCGWTNVWADTNVTSWHAEGFNPPGGVVVVQ